MRVPRRTTAIDLLERVKRPRVPVVATPLGGTVGPEGPAGKEGKEGPAGKEGKEGPAGEDGAGSGENPACRVYKTTATSIANATVTSLTFNAERYDNDGMHSTSSNTGRITINTPGVYLVTFHGTWGTSGGGRRWCAIQMNGATRIGQGDFNPAGDSMSIATAYKFAKGDYIEAQVYQSNGGAINLNAFGDASPEFSATYLSDG